MERSGTIDQLATALALVQSKLQPAIKDANNPFFKSKYADLSAIWTSCRDELAANDLAVVQSPGPCLEGQVEMTTLLLHKSGQFISGTLTIPVAKVDAQSYGSAITYARRYALAAMVGVVTEDDDGNAAARPAQGAAVNHGPAPRTRLEGPHTSKTALKTTVEAIRAFVRDASSTSEIDDMLKAERATIAQAERDWPELLNGFPDIEEDVGLKGVVARRRAELSDDGIVAGMIRSMKECDTKTTFVNWLIANEGAIEKLDGADARTFQLARDLHESGIEAMDTVTGEA